MFVRGRPSRAGALLGGLVDGLTCGIYSGSQWCLSPRGILQWFVTAVPVSPWNLQWFLTGDASLDGRTGPGVRHTVRAGNQQALGPGAAGLRSLSCSLFLLMTPLLAAWGRMYGMHHARKGRNCQGIAGTKFAT